MSTGIDEVLLAVGERLRAERERLGVNQTDFAEAGGVSKVSQFNYESGRRAPDAAYLALVAALGVDVGYVLTGQRAAPAAEVADQDEEVALVLQIAHIVDEVLAERGEQLPDEEYKDLVTDVFRFCRDTKVEDVSKVVAFRLRR